MTRSKLQFVVAFALGALTHQFLSARGGEFLFETNVVAGAAATMIAPRLWWLGIVALWIGHSFANLIALLGDGKGELAGALDQAFFHSTALSGTPLLFGAVLGAAAWFVVDRRRKKPLPQGDCRPPL